MKAEMPAVVREWVELVRELRPANSKARSFKLPRDMTFNGWDLPKGTEVGIFANYVKPTPKVALGTFFLTGSQITVYSDGEARRKENTNAVTLASRPTRPVSGLDKGTFANRNKM